MIGYNPNRDSGIAEPRSYVEIGKDSLQGLVEEYDFVPVATQRYFAQLVYNVGPGGGGGGGEFTPDEVMALRKLMPLSGYVDALMGVINNSICTVDIDLSQPGNDITNNEKLLRVIENPNNTYTIIDPTSEEYALSGDNNYSTVEYLINIPGYTCNIEAYAWVNQPGGEVTQDMEKLIPKLTYFPTKIAGDDYPYGKTVIYLDKENEYDTIMELPEGKRILRVTYVQLPSKTKE